MGEDGALLPNLSFSPSHVYRKQIRYSHEITKTPLEIVGVLLFGFFFSNTVNTDGNES